VNGESGRNKQMNMPEDRILPEVLSMFILKDGWMKTERSCG
jgi:hypothetical protein